MYALVEDYLAKMAYADTLAVLNSEYTSCSTEEESSKVSLQRKMTIDYGAGDEKQESTENAASLRKEDFDSLDDGSQLTVETE